MKWKLLVCIICTVALGLVCTIRYYNLDWRELADLSFYADLANPSVRIVKIQEGLRKEQIADIVGDKLGWDDAEKIEFMSARFALNQKNPEGYFFPKSYMLGINSTPDSVSTKMFHEFEKQVNTIPKSKTTKVVNQETALKIASIIQREAGKGDMKLISGIIWNRIFKGMKLQMDATLQYAKGNDEDGWWPQVESSDKKIDSPYNTYMYPSLPPSPIASPGLAAIEAAYNPQKTSCLFYLHDKKGVIHCSATYEGHLKNIDTYY
ncbi:MAG: endolytic transglycosylase MltG [Patescibacteria group bacterium]